MPLVSIIMGIRSRNSDVSMLKRAILSILKQSFGDFEFLICCDEESCREVYSLIQYFCTSDKRIHLILDGTALSLSQKLNVCLRQAKGSYIARMDGDDWADPSRLEKQISFLNANRDYFFVGSNVNIYRDGEIYATRELPEKPNREDFLFIQPYIHPTIMFRRECFDITGQYSEDRHCDRCEDFDFLMRMEEKGLRGYNLQEYLLVYTIPSVSAPREKLSWRMNYVITRWKRFKALGMLPRALPYVLKPLVVFLLPRRILDRLKKGTVYTSDRIK